MKYAVDKDTIGEIKDFKEKEYVYLFNKEPLDDLIKTGMHCIQVDYADKNDIVYAFKKDYKYAIIVPNYNNDRGNYKGKTWLQNCIESILNQTYKNFELIIVDDMSTDTSVETIESYKDKRIHLIKNRRKRYNGGSRNVGIECALDLGVDYICFVDSDDWWMHNKVLENINNKLFKHDMMILGCQMLFPNGKTVDVYNKYDNYEDIFFCINKVWCTCWSKVIKADKIVYFCEDTLMEDRVWTYKQADNIDFDKVTHLNEIVYCWNRLNTDNSVSMVRGGFWNASAWCHIGHQLQFLEQLKHEQFRPMLEQRIKDCINKANAGTYQQF